MNTTLTYNPAYATPPIVAEQCSAKDMYQFASDVVVGVVSIPQHVIDELRMAGISAISWLTQGELQDAIDACKIDGTLVDDHQGANFRDKLTLTEAERKKGRGRKHFVGWLEYCEERDKTQAPEVCSSF